MTYYDELKRVNAEYDAAISYFNNCEMENMDSAILYMESARLKCESMLSALRVQYRISKQAEQQLMKFEQEEEERETIVDLVKRVLTKKGVKKHAGLV